MERIVLVVLAMALLASPAYAQGGSALGDGLYTIGIASSSDMFKVVQCVLHVEDGAITAVLTLSGHGYGYLYAGTGEEADAAPKSDWVPFIENADGAYTYAIEIPTLDTDLAVAAYSTKYAKWYDRTLNFLSGSLRDYDMVPKDGAYKVEASSATLEPGDCALVVKDGAMTASFSLKGYDALRVGEAEYAAEDGVFSVAIPSLDKSIALEARSADGGAWSNHSLMFRSGALASLTVVPDDGVYTVSVRSDSNLFPVTGCKLTVKDGKMTALLSVESAKYGFLYPGAARDALKAAESDRIAAAQSGSGWTYTLPVQTLDQEIPVATWSAKKSQWYDRTLIFDSATLAPDEEPEAFSFAFAGGTGRVAITCPGFRQDGDQPVATIVFSSSKYTWAEAGGVRYGNVNIGGDSTFEIPVTLNGPTEIQAETTAMGDPRVVEYVLYLYTDGTDAAKAAGAGAGESKGAAESTAAAPSALPSGAPVVEGLTYESAMKLDNARCFQVYSYEGGYSVIRVADGRDYLIVPEGGSAPEGAGTNYVVLQRPLDRAYLAATSAMCLYDALDALGGIRFSGTKADDWHVERAAEAMEAGAMRYAGKYSTPDYELLLAEGCDLAIESTMILHAPEVQEKLEELGIPVWIDMSSYEPEPLGRTEWIKAYAVLLGKEGKAEKAFALQKRYVDELRDFENSNLTVAYFYVNSSGQIVTKPASDYFVRMIELAGGRYALAGQDIASDTSSSITMDAESFYTTAKDADFIIYNASIDDPPVSAKDFIHINAMFADFKAVREGNVWCTTKSLYQASDAIGQIVSDLHAMLTGNAGSLAYLYKLN